MPQRTMAVRPQLRYAARDSPPSLPSTSRDIKYGVSQTRPTLLVNSVAHAHLAAMFDSVNGLGELSALCIVDERNKNGPFISPADFDRRVSMLRHARLCQHFDVSFTAPSPQDTKTGSVTNSATVVSGICDATNAIVLTEEGKQPDTPRQEAALQNKEAIITFAAWNCARMSPRSANFVKKCSVLERLVADTPGLSVILLQEVVALAMEQVVERLRSCTGDTGWTAIGCGAGSGKIHHAHPRVQGATCQTALYNASKVVCLASSYLTESEIGPAEVTSTAQSRAAFIRSPHVCVFQPICTGDMIPKLLCVANCHISHKAPRQELYRLADLVQAMRTGCGHSVRRRGRAGLQRQGEVTYVVAGDFNQSSDSSDFRRLREEEDFVELVQSPRAMSSARYFLGKKESNSAASPEEQGCIGAPMLYLTEATTRGGQHIDNVWMQRSSRFSDMLDAWQYLPGGNGRGLRESGYSSAGRLRSERSDHVPIIVKLQLGIVENVSSRSSDTGSDEHVSRPWVLIKDFQATLTSQARGQAVNIK